MITRQQIDQLLQYRNGTYLVTSCYLNLDRAVLPPHALKIRIKDLIQAAQQDLAHKAASHDQRESLRKDFESIESFVLQELPVNASRGLAVFACAGQKFWQRYELPRQVRNILIADHQPYIRPLQVILEEYHRYGIVVVDRVAGQLYEAYMGRIMERSDMIDEVPRRVREGGLGGREERRIERHHDKVVQEHYQRLAGAAFDLFKRDRFDWLILAGHGELLPEFRQHLHPYLQERWVGDFAAEPLKTPAHEILRQATAIEERVEREQEQRLAADLIERARAGNLAVAGVAPTLAALGRGEAQLLLVEDGFATSGYLCRTCRLAQLEAGACPRCQQALDPSADVVDEAVHLAMQTNCRIEHVHGASPLREGGRMGAMLRYQS